MNPLELIDLIVWYGTVRGEVLSPIRLVKFLYLLDLYHARETNGRTLTGWPWAFVHYGPFCGEALDAIEASVRKGLIDARPYESRYDGEQRLVYRSPRDEEPRVAAALPTRVVSSLKDAIRKWGGHTPRLLDHVYFATEPMLTAVPGQRLDFSTAAWPPQEPAVVMRRLPPARVLEAKRLLAALRERAMRGLELRIIEAEREIRDRAYQAFLNQLEPDEPLPDIEGTARLTRPSTPESGEP